MKRFILRAALVCGAIGLLIYSGVLLGRKKSGPAVPLITEKSEVSAHTVVKEVLPIGEYASLAYRYTSVVKDINARDIKGWVIPFTTRKYIFTYDGIMKLGIDGTRILVEEEERPVAADAAGGGTAADSGAAAALPVITVRLPPIKILSHEIIDDSVEVFEQSQTIFNQIKIEDPFKVTAERKREMEEKVMSGDVVKEAQTSAEQQLGALLRNLPGIRDKYEIVFVWQKP